MNGKNFNEPIMLPQLVDFLRKFTELQSQQMLAIQAAISSLVENVMNTISNINSTTESKAREADTVLVNLSTAPDPESRKLMGELQNAADQVFENATISDLDKNTSRRVSRDQEPAGTIENNVRRLGGRFTKHMEALSTLDSEMKDLLFRMMGALSSDDVIRQRLEHVVYSGKLLAQFIEDLSAVAASGALDAVQVQTIRAKTLTSIYKSFTSEEEKEVFHGIFGRPIGKMAS